MVGKNAMALGLLLAGLCIAGCSDPAYSAGRPQNSTGALLENPWAAEWNGMKEDYEDLNQEILIYSPEDALLLTLSQNEDIFVFIRSKEMDKWDYSLSSIPPEARKLCTVVYHMEQEGQMVAGAVETVYCDPNGYYQISETPGSTAQNKMTEQAALYLVRLTGLELTGTQRFSEHEYYRFADDHGAAAGDETGVAPASYSKGKKQPESGRFFFACIHRRNEGGIFRIKILPAINRDADQPPRPGPDQQPEAPTVTAGASGCLCHGQLGGWCISMGG